MYCKFLIILFLTIIFFIKIIVVICNSSDIEGIEDCLIVEQLENSDDNLLDKVAYTEDEAYNLYNNYAL